MSGRRRVLIGVLVAMLAVLVAGGATLASASAGAGAARKHHKKHHRRHRTTHHTTTPPTRSSFTGCNGRVDGTVVQGRSDYPYVVRFVCNSSASFSSFQITLNRQITTATDPRGNFNCSASSTTVSCTSTRGAFNFQTNDPQGIPIGLNLSSAQSPCGSPPLSGQVTIPGDSNPIALSPYTNNCP